MPLTRDQLLTTARHERDALGRTVQYTPPERWEEPTPRRGWTARQVLAHLASTEVLAAAVLGGEEPAELDEYRKSLDGEDFMLDRWLQWAVERRGEAGPVSLGLEWGRAADLVLVRAGKASNQDWNERELSWPAGDLRVKYLVQARVAAWWMHGEDVREAGRLPPRREHWPIYAVNDLAVRLIPYALSRADLSVGDRTVEVDLAGTGGGSWHQSTGAGDGAAAKIADAVISGHGYAFASVASERADPDFCLYEGLLSVGGDVELAEAVLRTLRASP